MLRLIVVTSLVLLSTAAAQEQTYNLTLTTPKLKIVWEALIERPHKEVAPLLADIQKQISEQEKAVKKEEK